MADIGNFFERTGLPTYAQTLVQNLANSGTDAARIEAEVRGREDLYRNLYQNFVGRAPTEEEMGQLFTNVAPSSGFATDVNFTQELRDRTASYISDSFRNQAELQSELELQNQVGQAQTLADQFRQQGEQSLTGVEAELKRFTEDVFERVRPNLMTSLAAQGLLNTGGLNQAISGTLGDLTRERENFLMNKRLENEQTANQIAFAGAQAPLAFQQAQSLNRVPSLAALGTQAIGANYNRDILNRQFQHNANMLNMKNRFNSGPGFLSQLGQYAATRAVDAGINGLQQAASGGLGGAR